MPALLNAKIILKDTSNKRGESVTYVDSTRNQAHVLLKHSIFEYYMTFVLPQRMCVINSVWVKTSTLQSSIRERQYRNSTRTGFIKIVRFLYRPPLCIRKRIPAVAKHTPLYCHAFLSFKEKSKVARRFRVESVIVQLYDRNCWADIFQWWNIKPNSITFSKNCLSTNENGVLNGYVDWGWIKESQQHIKNVIHESAFVDVDINRKSVISGRRW